MTGKRELVRTRLLVLDASVAASWYIPNQSTAAATALLAAEPEAVWLAPFCFVHEVANLLLKQEKRGTMREDVVERMLDELVGIRVKVQPAPDDRETRSAIRVARRHAVSILEGFYLHLELEAGLELATRDGPLITAAIREGCRVADVRPAS